MALRHVSMQVQRAVSHHSHDATHVVRITPPRDSTTALQHTVLQDAVLKSHSASNFGRQCVKLAGAGLGACL